MKRFIKKNLAFFILPIIIGVPIFLVFVIWINNLSSQYKLKSSIEDIYVGDSHIKQAINDSIIPNSLNLAANSESFYFSYYKLKLILNNNPSIKKVYLGFSYHSLSNYYDRFINGDYSSAIAPKYFYILPPIEQFRMIYWNKGNLVSFIKGIMKQGLYKVVNNDYNPFLGGFSNSFENTSAVNSTMDKRILFQYYKNEHLNAFSELNIQYLNKIVSLCKAKGVELYTLNTPLHPYYLKKIPIEYKKKLNAIIHTENLNYLDLSNMSLNDNSFVPDGDHVSNIGAEAISIQMQDKARTHNTRYRK